jgi:hypothetical protein
MAQHASDRGGEVSTVPADVRLDRTILVEPNPSFRNGADIPTFEN